MQTALMLTSNEHSVMSRTATNGDSYDFLRSSSGFSLSREPRIMAANINATKHNTLPVPYNINSSTVLLSQYQHYIYHSI